MDESVRKEPGRLAREPPACGRGVASHRSAWPEAPPSSRHAGKAGLRGEQAPQSRDRRTRPRALPPPSPERRPGRAGDAVRGGRHPSTLPRPSTAGAGPSQGEPEQARRPRVT